MSLFKDGGSIIYKKILPLINFSIIIVLMMRATLENTAYESIATWIQIVLVLIWSGLMGTREMLIRGNKKLAILNYSLFIVYIIFMSYVGAI